jgi:hypothetical protein
MRKSSWGGGLSFVLLCAATAVADTAPETAPARELPPPVIRVVRGPQALTATAPVAPSAPAAAQAPTSIAHAATAPAASVPAVHPVSGSASGSAAAAARIGSPDARMLPVRRTTPVRRVLAATTKDCST